MKNRVFIFVIAIFAAPAWAQNASTIDPVFQNWLNQIGYNDPGRPIADFAITDPFCLNATVSSEFSIHFT